MDKIDENIPVWAYEKIELTKPDSNWKEREIQERKELSILLSAFGTKRVEHIGSTSIPNLPAKPIIDLIASIPSFRQINTIEEALHAHDWHYVPPELDKQPWRRFIVKVKNDKRIAHLHLMVEGEERWNQLLTFRDQLRANPHLVEEYAALKSHLAQAYVTDRERYTEGKTAFINRVLKS
ncbi:GrpB family protein [Fictibacillus phosphorivorans]|uniref:GrpB family protein n=1 Tax=Fictibacillus phosphorivorans TaxID=1221500 RepID=UPI001293A258|nr:GrpB family protein [Fictibacillus phosphorivorans]MQR94366.1 GrpB family protein [Fictibacillus phosphorivorans]